MAYIYHLLAFVLACFAVSQVTGQEEDGCLPGLVQNLRITGNGTLLWETPASEVCDILYYIVYIGLADSTVIWTYTVEANFLDVSFLIPCYGYSFRVHQVSADDLTGDSYSIFETTGPPSDANLAIQSLIVSRVGRNIRLDWSLDEDWVQCARRFRVLTYDEDSDLAYDFYTPLNSITMYNLVPCAQYTFGITAIFTLEEEGPVSTVRTVAPENYIFPPELISFSATPSTATLNFALEELRLNRCPITSLRIVSTTFTVSYPISNQANRTPFRVNLSGLTANSMYFLNVTANNTAGWSQPLLFGVQTPIAP